MVEKGTLYLCATPIGNLEDITLRALRILKEADLVAAEDTRRTRKLFSHFDIHTPLTSYHDHNSRSKGRQLVEQLVSGKNVALVSDAGLPGISDPGEELTALALSEGVRVVPVPGASASLAALVASGLPTGRFCFEGFLPARGAARRKLLEELRQEKRTLVIYEAPHRLEETLEGLAGALGGSRKVCVARELTKQFEEIWRGTLQEAVERFGSQRPRGEITLVIGGRSLADGGSEKPADERLSPGSLADLVLALEGEGLPRKEAIKEAARKSGLPKREVYAAVLEQKNKEGYNPSQS